jgi:hypothetical protein
MAAYAVMARIERVDPRFTAWDLERGPTDAASPRTPIADVDVDAAVALEADIASDPGAVLERLIRMRELWRQTTFYLFDADSWRT